MKRRDFLKMLTGCFLTIDVKRFTRQKKQNEFGKLDRCASKTPNVFIWLGKNDALAKGK